MANRKRTNYVYKALGRKLKIELHEPTPKNPWRTHVSRKGKQFQFCVILFLLTVSIHDWFYLIMKESCTAVAHDMLFNTFEQYVVCWCIYYCMCVVGGIDLWCSTLHSTIISKQSVLLVEETEVPGKNHRLVSSTPRH